MPDHVVLLMSVFRVGRQRGSWRHGSAGGRWRAAGRPQGLHRGLEARRDAFVVQRAPAAGDHHVARTAAPARRRRARRAGDRAARRAARGRAGRARAGRRAHRRCRPQRAKPAAAAPPARTRSNSRAAVDGSTPGARRHVAPAQRQPLAVFEPAQLLGPVARDLAVGADRQRHAGGQPARQVGQAVAEVGLRCSGRARRRRRCAATASISAGVAVRGVHQLPARVERRMARQPLDRPRSRWRRGSRRPRRSVRRRGCGSARRRRCARPARRSTSGRAARSEWIATPALTSGDRPRDRALQRAARRRRWSRSGAGRRAAPARVEAGALVEHRQQRQADAGLRGRVGQRPRHRRRIGVAAAVVGRAAGSGTRRPGCSRRAAARRRAAPRSRAAARA